MKLKLSDWASIAEIASGLAVLITLIFLVLGIRENTAVTRVFAYDSLMNSLNEIDANLLRDQELNQIVLSYYLGSGSELTDIQRKQVQRYLVMLFRTYERAFYGRQYDLLGETEWVRFEVSICRNWNQAQSSRMLPPGNYLLTVDFTEYMTETCTDVQE